MQPDRDIQMEAQRWLRFASDDLESARLHLATTLILPNQACYHAQQSAEKAIKAVLIHKGIPFPRTHDLQALSALLPPALAPLCANLDLARLTVWIIAARYPSDVPDASIPQAHDAIATATAIFERVRVVFSGSADAS